MKHKKNNLPFEVCNCGLCDTCGQDKPLDMMIRKQYKKGLYECKDCKSEREWVKYDYTIRSNDYKPKIKGFFDFGQHKPNKWIKAIKWAIG